MAAPIDRAAPAVAFRRTHVPGKTLGSLVPGVTRKAFEKYGFATSALLTDWASIAGHELASFTQPERLKWPRGVEAYGDVGEGQGGRPGATLILRADGPRATEVQYRHRQIIDRINAHFGYRAIAELRLVQAPIVAAGKAPPKRSAQPRSMTLLTTAKSLAKPSTAANGAASDTDPLAGALARLEAGMKARRAR